jgi:hypothetical protein
LYVKGCNNQPSNQEQGDLIMPLILTTTLVSLMLQAAPAPAQSAKAAEVKTEHSTEKTVAADPITDKNHPDYLRCRSERVIGSLAKRKKTCLTNKQWEEVARTGNRGARDIVESQQVGMNGGG